MKRIAIIPNSTKDAEFIYTKRIIDFLNGKAEILMEDKYSEFNAEFMPYFDLFEKAQYMIVLGGDGTILQIAAKCAAKNIPVLGINLGKIGFLTEIEPDNIEYALSKLLADEFNIEKRMIMSVEIIKDNGCSIHGHALNDVVVSKNAGARLIDIELYANNELVNKYIADGIIIATPTGSTGYSISAGGPVVDPSMELYVATPICAHTLSVRSAVLSAQKEIVISLDKSYLNNNAVISTDGDLLGDITSDDKVHITKSKYQFSIIKIGNHSFYDTVLKKLS